MRSSPNQGFVPQSKIARLSVARWLYLAAVGVVVVLFFLAIVGLSPFSPVSQDLVTVEAGSNIARQIILVVCFALSCVGLAALPASSTRRALPFSLLLLFVWLLISSLWAIDPATSIRRGLSLTLFTTSLLVGLRIVPVRRWLHILSMILLMVVVVDLVSVFLFEQARHTGIEGDRALMGAWRGMHNHKNRAGIVAAVSVLIFLYRMQVSGRKLLWFCALLVSVAFLVGTRSSASLLALAIAVVAYVLSLFYQNLLSAPGKLLLFLMIVLVSAFVVLIASPYLLPMLEDPRALTGRVAIWEILINYARAHPYGGSGFGSFWQIGTLGPALKESSEWAGLSAPHGHNGYLDILAALGVIGLALSALGLVVLPLRRLSIAHAPTSESALALGLFMLTYTHNLLESSLLAPGHEGWFGFLIAYAISCHYSPMKHNRSL